MELALIFSIISIVGVLFFFLKLKENENKIKELSDFYIDLHKFEKHISLLRKQFKDIEENFGEVGEIGRRLGELENVWKEIKQKQQELENILEKTKGDVERIDKVLTTLNEKLIEVEEIKGITSSTEKYVKDLNKKLELMEENATRMDSQIVYNKENIERLERLIEKLSERVEQISTVVGSYLKFRDELLTKLSNLTTTTATMEGRLKRVENYLDYIKDVEKNVRKIKAKFEAFEKSKTFLLDAITDLKEDQKKISQMLKKLKAPEFYEEFISLQKEIENMEEKIKNIEIKIKAINNQMLKTMEKINYLTMPDIEEVEFYKKEIKRIEEKLNELEKELNT